VREAGRLHQVGHANAVEAALAEQLRSGIQHPLAVFARLVRGSLAWYLSLVRSVSHTIHDERHIIAFMTIII
jgi:hypothetical protein